MRQIELIFARKILPSTPGVFAARVVTRGVDVTVNVGCKHSRTKSRLTFRAPSDPGSSRLAERASAGCRQKTRAGHL